MILETEKKDDQKAGQTQECLILSVICPHEKAQPWFLAPKRERVHQWLEIVRMCVKVRAKDLLEAKL